MQRRTLTAALAALALTGIAACSTTPTGDHTRATTTPAEAATTPDVIYHEPSDPPIEREPFTGNLTGEETTLLLTVVWSEMDREGQDDVCWGWTFMGSTWSLDNLRRGLDDVDINTPAAVDFFDAVC